MSQIKIHDTKITISVYGENIFAPNFPRSFTTQYFISLLNFATFS